MKILVTGGTGFLGRHLVPMLCRHGYATRIMTRYPDKHDWLKQYPQVEVVVGDVTNETDVFNAMQSCSVVIHAAGLFRFWGDEQAFYQNNLIGTKHVVNAACALSVQRLIHISTIAVVGGATTSHEVIDETYEPTPADVYQKTKLDAERFVLEQFEQHQFPAIVLRPGAYYGPMGTYAFNRLFFKDPMRGIIMQVENGKHIIFPVYIADVAQSILLALDKGRLGEIYNICGAPLSHREAFDIVCEIANIHFPRLPISASLALNTSRLLTAISQITKQEPFWPINMRSYVFNDWRVSSQKAQNELDFVPTSFDEGARRTVEWYQQNQPQDLPEFVC